MKVKFNRKSLVSAIRKVEGVVSQKNIINVFDFCHIEVLNNTCRITVGSAETQASCILQCEAKEDFEACLIVRQFFSTSQLLSGESIVVDVKPEKHLAFIKGEKKQKYQRAPNQIARIMPVSSSSNESSLKAP